MSSYRVTMTATDGATEIRTVDQDGYDELVDTYEVPGTTYPVATRERQRKDGTWATDGGGWDVRPRQARPEMTTEERRAEREAQIRKEHAETVTLNVQEDRRQNRRDYYLRTGR